MAARVSAIPSKVDAHDVMLRLLIVPDRSLSAEVSNSPDWAMRARTSSSGESGGDDDPDESAGVCGMLRESASA